MDMKRDYYEDVRLFGSKGVVFWFSALLLFLFLFPFLFRNYYVYMANYMAINVLVALGLNILVGYTGQISLGHAGFFAIGAYSTITLMSKAHIPFLISLPLSALLTAMFGFLLRVACPQIGRALSLDRHPGFRSHDNPGDRQAGFLGRSSGPSRA